MKKTVDDLVDEVAQPRGCRVRHIQNTKALEFVHRVTQLKREGKAPNLERSSEILEENWGIKISRRALSDHTRGKCSCPKK